MTGSSAMACQAWWGRDRSIATRRPRSMSAAPSSGWRSDAPTRARTSRPARSSAGAGTPKASSATIRLKLGCGRPRSMSAAPSGGWRSDAPTRARTSRLTSRAVRCSAGAIPCSRTSVPMRSRCRYAAVHGIAFPPRSHGKAGQRRSCSPRRPWGAMLPVPPTFSSAPGSLCTTSPAPPLTST